MVLNTILPKGNKSSTLLPSSTWIGGVAAIASAWKAVLPVKATRVRVPVYPPFGSQRQTTKAGWVTPHSREPYKKDRGFFSAKDQSEPPVEGEG